jgi:hypothetical protein
MSIVAACFPFLTAAGLPAIDSPEFFVISK